MTDTPTPNETKPADAPAEAQEKAVPADPKAKKSPVPANPALVEWPRDEYGNLSKLRQELLLAAGTVRGNPEKHKLFLATLGVAAQHAVARLDSDRTALQQEADDEVARIERVNRTGRVHGRAV